MQTYVKQVRRQGGSLIFYIPAPIARLVPLKVNDNVAVNLNAAGDIIITKLVSAQLQPRSPKTRV